MSTNMRMAKWTAIRAGKWLEDNVLLLGEREDPTMCIALCAVIIYLGAILYMSIEQL